MVNEQIRLLVELQKLDSEIISRDRLIKAIPDRISTIEKPLKEAEAGVKACAARMEAAEKKKRDRERDLDESNERAQKLRERTSQIKDNKAYQAHLKEIEAAEKASYAIEDEILELMEAVEKEAAGLKAAREGLEKVHEEARRLKEELEQEAASARESLSATKARRPGFTGAIDPETYDTYMGLLGDLGGLAVVEAAGEVCSGCNMNIMPQLFVEIKKNDRVIQCPQCRRILYYSEGAGQEG